MFTTWRSAYEPRAPNHQGTFFYSRCFQDKALSLVFLDFCAAWSTHRIQWTTDTTIRTLFCSVHPTYRYVSISVDAGGASDHGFCCFCTSQVSQAIISKIAILVRAIVPPPSVIIPCLLKQYCEILHCGLAVTSCFLQFKMRTNCQVYRWPLNPATRLPGCWS